MQNIDTAKISIVFAIILIVLISFLLFLYKHINSEELKKAYEAAAKSGDAAVEAFLKENGCEATAEDIRNFFKEQQAERELSEADMAGVAGGIVLGDDFDAQLSSMMPWQCNPHYSDFTHNGGFICA